MFRDLEEYQKLQKLYEEKVSKPKQLDELKVGPGPNTPPKKTTSFGDAIKMNQDRSATTTSTPKMSTSGAQITTNQRQSRDLASKNKDVKLNKFSRTQTYGADAKGVKLVPGAKVGQQVNRSTVQTKAEFDFGGIKKGERLGVMTRNQRRKYDLMAAQRAKKTEPKPDIKPMNANPFQGGPKTDEKKTTETKTTERKKPQYQINRDRQNRLRQQQNKGRAERQFGFLKPKPIERKPGQTSVRSRGGGVRQESYDAYDVVLEYLLTSQQAATIEEANYIMTEMDAETIQDIVSQQLNEQN